MKKNELTRRDFVKKTAFAVAGGVLLRGALETRAFARVPGGFEADPFDDPTVVRVYDPTVEHFDWDGSKSFYWKSFGTTKIQAMIEKAIGEITGEHTAEAAWRSILPGVSRSSKVAVKTNLNNMMRAYWAECPETSPPMMIALTRSLGSAGVSQANIVFFDASRSFPKEMKAQVWSACPDLVLLGSGETSESDTYIPLSHTAHKFNIPDCVIKADYLLSLHLFKKHYSGITGAMKNLFGLTRDVGSIAHDGYVFEQGTVIRDIMKHPEIRRKLKLNIGEMIIGARTPSERIEKLHKVDMFPNGTPDSVLVSRSPFHHDMVLYNFMNYEFNGDPNAAWEGTSLGWLTNCVNLYPRWTSSVVDSASVVAAGGRLPPKDLSYPSANVVYVSTVA